MNVAKRLIALILLMVISLSMLPTSKAQQAEMAADVVVVVDTSVSMKEQGMDPERASVLVAKLFSDLVPSSLTVIRLLDLGRDKHLVETRETGRTYACPEAPSSQCKEYEFIGDTFQQVTKNKVGALTRPQRGDLQFKRKLESELQATSNNSPFSLAFLVAQKIFEEHSNSTARPQGRPKLLVWLSDGNTDDPAHLKQLTRELKNDGVTLRSVIFGRGSSDISKAAGIEFSIASTPVDLMATFADIFRQIIGAPIDESGSLSEKANFNVPAEIAQAWVIVYGNKTLNNAQLVAPNGDTVIANFTQDSQDAAGAYQVAHIKSPLPGQWAITAKDGGDDRAFAVILDSSLYPYLITQGDITTQTPTLLEVSIKSNLSNRVVSDAAIVGQAVISAEIEGVETIFNDNGFDGDKTAGDRVFSKKVIFRQQGSSTINLKLRNQQTDTQRPYTLNVNGHFEYSGQGVRINFGVLQAGQQQCRSITINDIDLSGDVAMTFISDNAKLPSGHSLLAVQTTASEKIIFNATNTSIEICLDINSHANSVEEVDLNAATLFVAGSTDGTILAHSIPIVVSWETNGLSFWELWKNWIYLLLAIATVAFILAGIILPKRFRASLCVATGDTLQEVAEQQATQIKQWRGTGAGFYRNARAYIYSDHRISGKNKGAAVLLRLKTNSIIIEGINGHTIYHQGAANEWVAIENSSYRIGKVLRIGTGGLLFKLVDV